ncbi:YafY family protein [Microbacterium sp. Marseille-Q6965]|uniref:helix-turn-helix transcriptional regulator n=1 Tax=Microbacterium sp. Marseille-Q6965 TaxID=2965072 RepID=UPI0021B7C0E8|nr:WYL domain-containing protein [Microbacterium sp. Marseille-Q6965]
MDSPTGRTLELLALLQTGRAWSVPELAVRLRVSERTVRRDAQRLRGLGYDVSSRPGPGGAYRLRPSMRIPPMLLSADEISTLITSLLILEAWAPDDASVSAARIKLEQALTPTLRRRATATALSTHILHQGPAPVDWTLIGVLADAVSDGARVRFRYTDLDGRSSHRTVEPYRHVLHQRQWYIVAYDIDRADWRLFRMDRMSDLRSVAGRHQPREFPFDSIETWLTTDFGRAGRTSPRRPRSP